MPNTDLLSPWVRRFLLEHLVAERNLARNTQKSYRDALQQFLPFIARAAHRQIEAPSAVASPYSPLLLLDLFDHELQCSTAPLMPVALDPVQTSVGPLKSHGISSPDPSDSQVAETSRS